MDYYFTICTKPVQKVHGCVHWKEMFISNKNYTVIRCRDRATDKLLGQIVIELAENDAWIFFLSVKPICRENGIGTKLMSLAEKFIKKANYTCVLLHPQKEFEDRLIPWYEKQGYSKMFRDPVCKNEWLMIKSFLTF